MVAHLAELFKDTPLDHLALVEAGGALLKVNNVPARKGGGGGEVRM